MRHSRPALATLPLVFEPHRQAEGVQRSTPTEDSAGGDWRRWTILTNTGHSRTIEVQSEGAGLSQAASALPEGGRVYRTDCRPAPGQLSIKSPTSVACFTTTSMFFRGWAAACLCSFCFVSCIRASQFKLGGKLVTAIAGKWIDTNQTPTFFRQYNSF